jgi:hypothetical protein
VAANVAGTPRYQYFFHIKNYPLIDSIVHEDPTIHSIAFITPISS